MRAKFKLFPTRPCGNCGHNSGLIVVAKKGNMEKIACQLCGYVDVQQKEGEKC